MICPDRQDDRTCARGYYDGKRLSEGVCQLCTVNGRKPPPARGVGDLIARATHAIGIKPCGGCKKRQAALNRALPFGQSR